MDSIGVVLIFIGLFLGFSMLLRVDVSTATMLAGLGLFIMYNVPFIMLPQSYYSAVNDFTMIAVPFFVFAGELMQYSGISRAIIGWVESIAGRVRGCTGTVAVLASMAFGVITGSQTATFAAIGGIMIPEMDRKGYTRAYTAALVGSASFLGILIPPSIPGILYATAAGAKVSQVWLSTVVPGFLIGAGFIIINMIGKGKNDVVKSEGAFNFGAYMKNVGVQTKNSIAALLMPIIIFGSIYGGIATPTEAGAICSLYGIIYFFYKLVLRKQKMEKSLFAIVASSAGNTGMVCLLLATSKVAGIALTMSGVANGLAQALSGLGYWGFLVLLNLILLFMGTFMTVNAGILILTPLLLPTAINLGISPIHFGGVMLLNLCIGFMTPPFAGIIFMGVKYTGAKYIAIVKEILPFIAWSLVVLVICTIFPATFEWLPNLTA